MLQAMNTGHEGSLSTCHANSPADALARLETMVLGGDVALRSPAVREQPGAPAVPAPHGRRAPGRAAAPGGWGTMVLGGHVAPRATAVREQLVASVDLVVQVARVPGGG